MAIFNSYVSLPGGMPLVIYGIIGVILYIHVDYKPLTKWDVLPSGEPGGCFSPSSVSTLRGFYGRCKGRCLIRVLTLVCGILPVNFCIKWLL